MAPLLDSECEIEWINAILKSTEMRGPYHADSKSVQSDTKMLKWDTQRDALVNQVGSCATSYPIRLIVFMSKNKSVELRKHYNRTKHQHNIQHMKTQRNTSKNRESITWVGTMHCRVPMSHLKGESQSASTMQGYRKRRE